MKTKLLTLSLSLGMLGAMADTLTVQPQKILAEQTPSKITLTLDQPADSATLELRSYKRPFHLNGSDQIVLKPSDDKKTFTAELKPESFYHPVYNAGRVNGAGAIEVIPVVTRSGKTERLKAFHPWETLKITALPQKANQVKTGYGKFGKALSFDGKDAMAAVNQVAFHDQKGTMEAWVFLPLMLTKSNTILWFLQSADGSPWRYHQLSVPANSRKVEYMTYNGETQNPVSRITSKEITGEDWVFLAATYDLAAKKMELFVNGESQGTAPYTVPCGGKRGDLNIGARIHNAGDTVKFIQPTQMMIDDLRISDTLRGKTVPSKPLEADANTLLLLNADGTDQMK